MKSITKYLPLWKDNRHQVGFLLILILTIAGLVKVKISTRISGRVSTKNRARIKGNPQACYFPAGITVAPAAFNMINLLFPISNSETVLNPYF